MSIADQEREACPSGGEHPLTGTEAKGMQTPRGLLQSSQIHSLGLRTAGTREIQPRPLLRGPPPDPERKTKSPSHQQGQRSEKPRPGLGRPAGTRDRTLLGQAGCCSLAVAAWCGRIPGHFTDLQGQRHRGGEALSPSSEQRAASSRAERVCLPALPRPCFVSALLPVHDAGHTGGQLC